MRIREMFYGGSVRLVYGDASPWGCRRTAAEEDDRPLFSKHLTDVLEGFEFQGIARGVEKEHRCLLAREAFEPDIGFDDEFDGLFAQSAFQCFPVCPF